MSGLSLDTIVRVEEIVTDVLAMDLLHSSKAFFSILLEVANQPADMRMIAIRRSVADTSLGETDIEIVAEAAGKRYGILIENKVRAPLMDRQFARYRMRGEAGIKAGHWSGFSVILMSPRSYYEALDEAHSTLIDANLSYERIVAFLDAFPEFAFKKHVFESAIADYRKGYFKSPDTVMMQFYGNYWEIASTDFPQLRMKKPDIVGKDGSWIYFPGLYAGNSVRLIHKFKGIGCELAVVTRQAERLVETLAPFLDIDMVVRPTKSMAFVNIKTAPIDHMQSRSSIREDIVASLQTLERLRLFAMRPEVRRLIMASL